MALCKGTSCLPYKMGISFNSSLNHNQQNMNTYSPMHISNYRTELRNNLSTFHANNGQPNQTSRSSINRGQVVAFRSSSKWKVHFEASKQSPKLIVIDFTATWCKPCQNFQPVFDFFAQKYTNVEFVKIDIEELQDVAGGFGVQILPTFLLLKRGKEVDRVAGVKREQLQKKIEKHMI